jgi:glyoxylase-like metal-dependent hydrolase (beta-lactamase superfamily II)
MIYGGWYQGPVGRGRADAAGQREPIGRSLPLWRPVGLVEGSSAPALAFSQPMRFNLFQIDLGECFMRLGCLALGAALAACPGSAQPAATPPAALVREGVTERLSAHVWAIPDGAAPLVPNIGIVVGDAGVLVVDTGMGLRNGETVLREVTKLARGKPIYIVTTHVHPEHDLGAQAFPQEAKMIRSKDQVIDIAASGMRLAAIFAARSPLNAELLHNAVYRGADIEFEDDYLLDLGGVSARIYAMGLNHTLGDTAVIVEGVLFSGDLAMRPQPSIMSPDARISHWLASLDRLDAMQPVHVVPSHGARGGPAIIAGYRSYLLQIRNRTAALKGAGRALEQVIETLTGEMALQYPDVQRLAGAIRAAYAEAQ